MPNFLGSSGGDGSAIDDGSTSTSSVWSSAKTDSELKSVSSAGLTVGQANVLANLTASGVNLTSTGDLNTNKLKSKTSSTGVSLESLSGLKSVMVNDTKTVVTGHMETADLTATGDIVLSGTTSIASTNTLNKILVDDTKVELSGTIRAVGDIECNGAIDTNRVSNDISGLNMSIDANLKNLTIIGGNIQLDGNTTVSGTLNTTGNITQNGSQLAIVDDAKTSTTTAWSSDKIQTELNTVSAGGITAGEQAILDSLYVSGGDLKTASNTEVGGNLDVVGTVFASSIASKAGISNDITLAPQTNLIISTPSGSTQVSGDVTITGNLSSTNTDSHIADVTKHRVINDAGVSTTDLWSASKIQSEITTASSGLTIPEQTALDSIVNNTAITQGSLTTNAITGLDTTQGVLIESKSTNNWIKIADSKITANSNAGYELVGDMNINGALYATQGCYIESKNASNWVTLDDTKLSSYSVGGYDLSGDVSITGNLSTTTQTSVTTNSISAIDTTQGVLIESKDTNNWIRVSDSKITANSNGGYSLVGNVSITGNLEVSGSTLQFDDVSVEDALLKLSAGYGSNERLNGFYAQYGTIQDPALYSGLMRHPASGWYVFDSKSTEPSQTYDKFDTDYDGVMLSDANPSTLTIGNTRCLSTTQPNKLPSLTTTARDNLTPVAGQIFYNNESGLLEYFTGFEWVSISTTTPVSNHDGVMATVSNTYTIPSSIFMGRMGVYGDKLYLANWDANYTNFYRIDTKTSTVVEYSNGGALTGVRFHSIVDVPSQNRGYMITVMANGSSNWYYIDYLTESVIPYDSKVIVSDGDYRGGVYHELSNRIYLFPNGKTTASEWHYLDCTTLQLTPYTNTESANMITGQFLGGVHSPTQDRIYLSSTSNHSKWAYIDNLSSTPIVHTFDHLQTLNGSAYAGGAYHAELDRVYFTPYGQANNANWHYIDCKDGSVVSYEHKMAVPQNGYIDMCYSPHTKRIYMSPYAISGNALWHYIDLDGTVVAYATNNTTIGSYYGVTFHPTTNNIYFTPYTQSVSSIWAYIEC